MQIGDLIFTQIGPSDNAISAVTEGYKGARINHVGIVIKEDSNIVVLEAFPPKVQLTKLSEFIDYSKDANFNPRYLVGRLHHEYERLISSAINYGLSKLNIPYDISYLPGEESLYCSKLIVDMFRYANGGEEFFPEVPMDFRDPNTGKIHPYWIEYYSELGIPVPQDELGSNPGHISKDEKLYIYKVVGNITGYRP